MRTIFKYVIDPSRQQLSLPAHSVPLHVAFQGDLMCLWTRIDLDTQVREPWGVRIYGTGMTIPDEIAEGSDGWAYFGTVQQPPYVWHVYLRKPEP